MRDPSHDHRVGVAGAHEPAEPAERGTPIAFGTRGGLQDGFGRRIDYLRISLTDRCNMRCRYCMPVEGPRVMPGDSLLSADEIERVVRVAADLGFRKVRLTGGEPTLRRDLVDIVGRIAAVEGIQDVAMTTNGARLPRLARPLADAGLRRVNVHVDSLDADRMADLMRWGRLQDVWAGIEAAEAAGLTPLKINTVVAKGYNDGDDVVRLSGLARQHPWTVRFIELMPLGGGQEGQFSIDRYVPNAKVRARIEAAWGRLEPVANEDPADEARNFRWANSPGTVGFISPVSEPYCGTCNRMRLTADGKFHLCLLHDDEIDVREALRGDDPDAVRMLLERAVARKPTGHALAEGVQPERRMHAIGG